MSSKSPRFQQAGQQYHQFLVTRAVEIPELQCHLRELVHLPTGAQVMHIANEDPENLFCLSFQTFPNNSQGVAHILEHTVLCGSKKFPVKDPFFAMTRRSLNTFMNALTGADFTCYPAATQVPQDFYNLLDVYIDAVFHPNLNKYSFLQEGHRLEFAQPDNPSTPLEYKGIVFNEMKGALASANSRLNESMHRSLFPDLPYGYNSGGDPKDIPKLTYDDLVDFHKKFYHPSRCLFFFYGNLPLEKHLDFIDEQILKETENVPALAPLPNQPRFMRPHRITERYPASHDESYDDKTYISFGWLTCHILQQHELLSLNILEIILLDTDASPLKMALLKSGYCKQVSSYIDDDISEIPLTITLRGCNPEHADKLEEIIMNTISQIIRNGIPLEHIENALHQLEFYRSEITGDHGPFGLSLFMRSALLKQHGGNPEEGLMIHSLFEEIRKKNLENPRYLTDLLQKHLVDNPHFVRIVMQPDNTLSEQELREETAELDRIRQQLTQDEVQNIVNQASALTKFQEDQECESLDVLPKLNIDDVPKSARSFELREEKVGNLHVFHHSAFTNSIAYVDLVYDLPAIEEKDLPLVRLFAVIMPQIGCGGRSYVDNLEYIQAHTGGVGASLAFNLQASDPNKFTPSFYIRGKALHRKASKLFSLFLDMATSLDFTDIPRLREVIMKHYTGLQSSLQQNALKYAINLSASGLDVPSKIANDWYGLEYYWRIKEIAENFDRELPQLLLKLNYFKEHLFCLENPHLVITCDSPLYDEIKGHHFYGLDNIPTRTCKPWSAGYPLPKVAPQGRIIPSPIAFTGKVFKTVPYSHPNAPALNVAAFLCDNLVLHTNIREKGGAYGGGAICNSMAANFYFYSYRDPNISSTLAAFEESIKEIIEGKFDESDLEEAKMEMVQALDSPVAPGSRGELAYSWLREGKSFEIRQEFRNKLLALTMEDVISAVKAELHPNYLKGSTVVFAGPDLLNRENAIMEAKGFQPLTVEKV